MGETLPRLGAVASRNDPAGPRTEADAPANQSLEGQREAEAAAAGNLTPVLLSGGGRTGSTAIMELLGTDPRVAFDREYPFESRYLLYFAKFAKLFERPEYFRFLDGAQLFDFSCLGFSGAPPATTYVPSSTPEDFLPRLEFQALLGTLWSRFSGQVRRGRPLSRFYTEKSPSWLAPLVRECLPCYTIYNLRDPRDIFISANAFMKKRNYLGFARLASDTDLDHARHLALAFAYTFENYYMDRQRADCVLLRYEDFVLRPLQVVEQIRNLCGIEARNGLDSRLFSIHRTAKDLKHTVNRWKSDSIPREVVRFLERALQAEMAQLGYEITEPGKNPGCTTISFAGGTDLSRTACSPDGYLEQGPEYAVVNVDGIDFWILLPLDSFDAAPVRELWLSVRGEIGDVFMLYWHGPNGYFSQERRMALSYTPSAHWTVLSFPVHTHPLWQGTISKVRLDLFNANRPPHRGRGHLRWVRLVG